MKRNYKMAAVIMIILSAFCMLSKFLIRQKHAAEALERIKSADGTADIFMAMTTTPNNFEILSVAAVIFLAAAVAILIIGRKKS